MFSLAVFVLSTVFCYPFLVFYCMNHFFLLQIQRLVHSGSRNTLELSGDACRVINTGIEESISTLPPRRALGGLPALTTLAGPVTSVETRRVR